MPMANIKYCNHNRNRVCASSRVRPCPSGGYRYGKYLTFIIDSTGFGARISDHSSIMLSVGATLRPARHALLGIFFSLSLSLHNIHVNICISVGASAHDGYDDNERQHDARMWQNIRELCARSGTRSVPFWLCCPIAWVGWARCLVWWAGRPSRGSHELSVAMIVCVVG